MRILPVAAALWLGLGLGLTLAAPARACTPVAPQVELCTEGTIWADINGQDISGIVVWEGGGFFLEFNPALTAVTPDGPLDAALDELLNIALAEAGAPAITPLRRDRLDTGAAVVERLILEIDEGSEPYLAAIMLADLAGGGPRLAWSMGMIGSTDIDALVALTEATARGLRHGSEN